MPAIPLPDPKTTIEAGLKIAELFASFRAYFNRRDYILFTGMEGVGKTALLDHLSGKAYSPKYRLPRDPSQIMEIGKLPGAAPVGLRVVPGQSARGRTEAVMDSLLGRNPPLGIIHVVANGFALVRPHEPSEIQQKIGAMRTIQEYQTFQRIREIDELKQVCQWIEQAHHTRRKPSWLIVAATKSDLYSEQDHKITRKTYLPGGAGEVVSILDNLRNKIGSNHFAWSGITICSGLEAFVLPQKPKWTRESQPSMTSEKRNALLLDLTRLIEERIRSPEAGHG